MLTQVTCSEPGQELATPSHQMRRFLSTSACCESYVAGHLSRQKDKQLISLLDSVLTTLKGVGVVEKPGLTEGRVKTNWLSPLGQLLESMRHTDIYRQRKSEGL